MGRGLFAGTKMAKDRQSLGGLTEDTRSVCSNQAKHDPLAGSTQAKGIVVEK